MIDENIFADSYNAVCYCLETNNTVLFSMDQARLAYQQKVANFRSGTLSYPMKNVLYHTSVLTQAKLENTLGTTLENSTDIRYFSS